MKKYRANWFDHGDWKYHELEVLAENEQQVRDLVDTRTDPKFRDRRNYKPDDGYNRDSLQVHLLGEVTIPYVIGGNSWEP